MQQNVELAQAHTQQVGHLLLLHLILELKKLEGTHQIVVAMLILLGLASHGSLAVAQQAGGALNLVKQNLVHVDRLLGLLSGLRLGYGSLVNGLDLGGLYSLGLFHHVVVVLDNLGHNVLLLRPSAPPRVPNPQRLPRRSSASSDASRGTLHLSLEYRAFECTAWAIMWGVRIVWHTPNPRTAGRLYRRVPFDGNYLGSTMQS